MSECKKILLMEDDTIQADWLASLIWKIIPDAEIRYYDSEYSLKVAASSRELQDWGPDRAVVDLLVRYFSPDDLAEMKVAPDVSNLPIAEEAGVRCRKLIMDACPGTPVAIVTVLNREFAGCLVMQKGNDEFASELSRFLS